MQLALILKKKVESGTTVDAVLLLELGGLRKGDGINYLVKWVGTEFEIAEWIDDHEGLEDR